MRANRVAAEEGRMLRLRVFARKRWGRAIGGPALGKKITETLLPLCGSTDLAVSD
jgi:hypothetical protein